MTQLSMARNRYKKSPVDGYWRKVIQWRGLANRKATIIVRDQRGKLIRSIEKEVNGGRVTYVGF